MGRFDRSGSPASWTADDRGICRHFGGGSGPTLEPGASRPFRVPGIPARRTLHPQPENPATMRDSGTSDGETGLEPGTPRFSALHTKASNNRNFPLLMGFCMTVGAISNVRSLRTFWGRLGTEAVTGTQWVVSRRDAGRRSLQPRIRSRRRRRSWEDVDDLPWHGSRKGRHQLARSRDSASDGVGFPFPRDLRPCRGCAYAPPPLRRVARGFRWSSRAGVSGRRAETLACMPRCSSRRPECGS
jgi:hypothetical protein